MNTNQSFSDLYVNFYHLFNSGKNYQSEMEFVLEKYAEFSGKELPHSVLDLGCGLGDHLKFIPQQVEICVGVDSSATMIEKAIKQNSSDKVGFVRSTIRDYKPKNRYDLVFSLFHVLSYQTELDDLIYFFKTISAALEPDGVALADFWHRPVWDTDPPVTRRTERENQFGKVIRDSRPSIDFVSGKVDINMQVQIIRPLEEPIELLESHHMRAFTLLELELLANFNGLKILESGDWDGLNSKSLTSSTWYGYVVLKKEANGK